MPRPPTPITAAAPAALVLALAIALLVPAPAPAGAPVPLVINEVDYAGGQLQFVELYNNSDSPVNVDGYALETPTIDPFQPLGDEVSVPARGVLAVCFNDAGPPECGLVSGESLPTGGEGYVRLTRFGGTVDAIGWGGSTEAEGTVLASFADSGAGKSLSRCADGVDTNENDADVRRTDTTPGTANFCPSLVVNEFDTVGGTDFVEVRNTDSSPVDLDDYVVISQTDSSSFPPGTTLSPGAVIATDLGLSDSDGFVVLRTAVSDQTVDAVGYGDEDQIGEGQLGLINEPDAVSGVPTTGQHGLSRCEPDSDNNVLDFFGLTTTRGAPNACPTLLINEVDYDVGDGETEFFEIVNTSTVAIDLFDLNFLVDNGEVLDQVRFTNRGNVLPGGGRTTICLADIPSCPNRLTSGNVSLDDEAGGLGIASRWSLGGFDGITWEGGGLLAGSEPGPPTTSLADPGAGMTLSRCPDSTPAAGTLAGFIVAAPTLNAANACQPAGPAALLINEVGHTGNDFIEIHNPTDAAVDLAGFDLIIDPPRQQVVLNGTIAAGGYRTVCLNNTACDQDVAGFTLPDGPSGIALRDADRNVLDVLSWGDGGVAPDTQAEGGSTATLIDPGEPAGNSLSRCPDATDTDDNAGDFSLQARSLGLANPCTGPITADGDGAGVVTIPVSDATATSIAFSQLTYPDEEAGGFAQGVPTEVLLASDTSFADALASGTLQATRPLLLNDRDALEDPVLAEIQRLGATTVRVLGGTAVVSDDVIVALQQAGLTVTRTFGPTRLETAEQIAQLTDGPEGAILSRAFPAPGGDDTQAFADSLAAGGWAAAAGLPVLLTQTEVLSTTTDGFLDGSTVRTAQVVGGASAIDQPVIDRLGALGIATSRTSGATRFATAVAIATARGFTAAAPAATVIVVEGQAANAWEAGFTAAGTAAALTAPVVLANGDALPQETQAFLADVVTPGEDQPALVCAASAAACSAAETALGL